MLDCSRIGFELFAARDEVAAEAEDEEVDDEETAELAAVFTTGIPASPIYTYIFFCFSFCLMY